jgi:tripartite-type tricarboxylate transporter receptor subunit TctC
MDFRRRQVLHLAAGAAALPALPRAAMAQIYPSRPITMVVPFPAGSRTDTFIRIVTERMRDSLGQLIIIENIVDAAGETGCLGTGMVARAAGDGYMLVAGDWSSHCVNGVLYPHSYDVVRDFEPIALLASNLAMMESYWWGIFAPRNTPREVVAKLGAAAMDALADSAVCRRLAHLLIAVPPRDQQTPEALAALQKAEIEYWWPLIKANASAE